MKKTILLSLMASSLMMAGNNTILDNEFAFEPSIAVLAGYMKNENSNNADKKAFYGVEFGFNCLATDTIRQQVQLTKFENTNIEILQVNINPHYLVTLSDTVKIGFGPTLGFATVDNGIDSDTIFTYGVGTSLSMDVTQNIFLGAEVKYELTQDATLLSISDDADNVKVFAKVGYRF